MSSSRCPHALPAAGEDYFTHAYPPAYKGDVQCRGIDFNDNVGTELLAVGKKYDGQCAVDPCSRTKEMVNPVLSAYVPSIWLRNSPSHLIATVSAV